LKGGAGDGKRDWGTFAATKLGTESAIIGKTKRRPEQILRKEKVMAAEVCGPLGQKVVGYSRQQRGKVEGWKKLVTIKLKAPYRGTCSKKKEKGGKERGDNVRFGPGAKNKNEHGLRGGRKKEKGGVVATGFWGGQFPFSEGWNTIKGRKEVGGGYSNNSLLWEFSLP